MNNEETQQRISDLLRTQKLAVLATQNSERPYTSLVAFAYSDDFKQVYFVTSRATKKYDNLMNCPQVALLVDNRKNTNDDFQDAVAATIIGSTRELDTTTTQPEIDLFLNRHPELKAFVYDKDSALFATEVTSYVYVCNFGSVSEFKP